MGGQAVKANGGRGGESGKGGEYRGVVPRIWGV